VTGPLCCLSAASPLGLHLARAGRLAWAHRPVLDAVGSFTGFPAMCKTLGRPCCFSPTCWSHSPGRLIGLALISLEVQRPASRAPVSRCSASDWELLDTDDLPVKHRGEGSPGAIARSTVGALKNCPPKCPGDRWVARWPRISMRLANS